MHPGRKIKELREKQGWTQIHLAEATGLSLRTIQRIEKNGRASKESLLAIAAVFDCPVEDLLSDDKIIKIEYPATTHFYRRINQLLYKLEEYFDHNRKKILKISFILALPALYFFLANIFNYYLYIPWFSIPIKWMNSSPSGRFWFNLLTPPLFLGGLVLAIILNILLILRGRFRIGKEFLQTNIRIELWKPAVLSFIIYVSVITGMLVYLVAENIIIH